MVKCTCILRRSLLVSKKLHASFKYKIANCTAGLLASKLLFLLTGGPCSPDAPNAPCLPRLPYKQMLGLNTLQLDQQYKLLKTHLTLPSPRVT